ncbi:GGDEF domain-containing protein [Sulfurimonas sp.]|jgi:EAL domain-containing protein (putative c-di-GMP-specific phosphodiesterase class I)/GGDEF domain-containing protein|uniref:bifunctional diguanylate cyclase/phosphodiesterase n=1 Tax=Sulfurimonas sp. TaxID=2022749 RepID=UPI0025E7161B|nr:GGDEF domain-containing protein [Sulfurimonas sp.]MCK9472986.1 GGDEF domain-containing protein [Sulfurimonas sp.]MDD3505336.1 GGDEF domain-containing protein [Sulfurimonas sp.]
MLLPEIKEREYRFKLALRMVLPIFALVIALVFHTFSTSQETLNTSFYIESILILVFSIYFIFYLIYKGFDTKIIDSVSKAFTREYIYEYLKKKIKTSKEYTLILLSVDNLYEINSRYGIKIGDKVLFETLNWIVEYLKSKDIYNISVGRIKGGDFIIGVHGDKNRYKTIIELMCLKSEEFKIDDIEIQISGVLNDITFSKDIDYLIENLFELQDKNKSSKLTAKYIDEDINPNELEYSVINAIKRKDLVIYTQTVFEKEVEVFKECFVKLETEDEKLLHQKNYMKILDKLRLMGNYDLIVLEKVINMCTQSDGNKFAIQISPTSLRNSTVLTKIKEIFTKNECAKNRIILLFQESEYYPRVDKFNATLQQLRSLGVLIAVDRLASLHTSFLYLRDLDIDIVRFDSYYTKNSDEGVYKNIISGFNVMAHEKGLKTWIKMIENQNCYTLAKELGVDYMQGRYLAPLEKIEKKRS